MSNMSSEQALQTFSFLRKAPKSLHEAFLQATTAQKFPKDLTLYVEGDSCSQIAFLLEGEVRVFKIGETGREITLYEIGPGDSCILNASCILSQNVYPANAVTLSECNALMMPAHELRRLLSGYEEMRSFIFTLLSDRLATVMALVEEVAFEKMDVRLMDYVVEKAENNLLIATHQKIASDLGTSREVVSRLLKDMERKGLVALARNEIKVLS